MFSFKMVFHQKNSQRPYQWVTQERYNEMKLKNQTN